jgi:peptidoglycan/xylan/chitin deacetylase (PgdA/CDA1 family)/CelD/BcsL family acetyltransferase involved in cellulose biosynthesis
MRVVEIGDENGLAQLRPAWDALVGQSASNTIFVTWEWLAAWWSAYGAPGELRLLAIYDEAGPLRGIAPLRSSRQKRYGQSVAALSFVGDGSFDSDYLDFISAPGCEDDVVAAVSGHLAGELKDGAVLALNEIPDRSRHLGAIRKWGSGRGMVLTEADVPCATVRLPETWDAYLALLKPRFRTKARSVLRNLESRANVRFGFCESHGELDRLLPALFDLHARRWQQEGKPGVFGIPGKQNFYRTVSAALLERGRLRFSFLEWNGRILACQYGFVYEGVYSQLQEGYEPAVEHWNVGIGLRSWSIRELLKQGVREYDFLGGVSRHKTDWGAEVKHSKRILLGSRTRRNALFLHGPEWETQARESIRALVPDAILRARQARAQRHEPGDAWVRKAAAACYVHSGAPALLRYLRRRYEISMRGHGGLPGFSWRRRAESGARIFYYHRVNNDGDPFFPAISTDLFEAHVRYLARHYRVVGMSELQSHLASGDSLDTVVAVTFDDGYRDNYEYAFPILQRYGLPATIFLSTGSIDSGEPVWFERLAQAVKKTSREFLDVEIDLPRRFWMRTESERLEASGGIFRLLRRLGDAERRHWLGEILRLLDAGREHERRGKMLTWDQVRAMKASGIEFGGHTVTHPFLSKLTAEQAAWEVSECKRRIEEEMQAPVGFFAYPNGREEDFAASNKKILRDAGYRGAVTTIWGMNYRSTDPMELRRGGPWENHPGLFALKLDWYQLANQ